ncbi:hypothetical protein ACFXHA_40805 [Nocardia sp. NPDC059240]|uniref:hypothetical protein n=1 Tax=Nocardia sp. NPDC059240 TaxID=3346786 RepID=UPI0036810B1E
MDHPRQGLNPNERTALVRILKESGDLMTAALLAAVSGVVGLAIGRLWDNRSESMRWIRDRKMTTYQVLIEKYGAVLESIYELALTEPTDETTAARERSDLRAYWNSAVATVSLHGSTGVVVALDSVDHEIVKLHEAAVRQRPMTQQQWNQASSSAHQAFGHFIEAARKELGLSRVPESSPHRAAGGT